MAALVAVCSALGKRKFTRFPAAFVCLTNPGTRAVLCRSCSQYKQVTSNEDLPIPMENPYKEPLKKCILCEKRVDYKNVQVFVGRNKKKSQKQLRELKYWSSPATFHQPDPSRNTTTANWPSPNLSNSGDLNAEAIG
ncbi:small ribosomal subunit protein bS18m isoform X4 [Odocoileus virginianus]|uniref:Small ribosomal subunit protein bS18m isoform X4 n=1 Tax=Odocoileus virginianus TaxID=9874 RepID=A0ABM4HFG9_ODOVR